MQQCLRILLVGSALLSQHVAYAQASYFNVAESDVAERGEVIVQQQVSFQQFIRSITTIDYGIARNFEIGANLINLDYYPESRRFLRNDSSTAQAYSPLLMLNAQKIIDLGHDFLPWYWRTGWLEPDVKCWAAPLCTLCICQSEQNISGQALQTDGGVVQRARTLPGGGAADWFSGGL